MKQQGNGGSKRSPEAVSRMESALESERRQRELLERRLLDTERRLEAALAAVQAPAPNDAALLLLKSSLMAEMEAAEYRAQLETELLALELLANAEAEAFATPAAPLPPQRVIQYIHVPAPETAEAAPAQPVAIPAPKDFDDKLAAAQMAIDAAEARASHNAVQVRKLTEELAAARAEQIRLSAEVRQLAERYGVDIPAPSALRRAAPESPAPSLLLEPLAEVTPVAEAAPAVSAHDDVMEDLASALSDWGAPEVVEAPAAADADLLEDALASFGDSAPEQSASEASPEASGLDLEDALQAWGDGALESATLDTPEPAASAADATPVDDALVSVLEGWGEETAAPTAVEAAEDFESLLEVDTLARLDTPELPAEERIADALGDALFGGIAEARADELLEDLESSVVLEEEQRWEPTPAVVDEDEMETIGAWSVLSPEDRLDAAPPEDEAVLLEEEEPAVAVSAEEIPEEPTVETLLADAVPELDTAAEEEAPATGSHTITVLEEAEMQRREILAARDEAPAVEPEQEVAQDFQPDLTALVKRGAASRAPQQPATAKGGRDAMIDALQQFIGE